MISIKTKDQCCGCGSCYSICQKHCIEMSEDEEGFLYPTINKEACIGCNLCRERCPMLNVKDKSNTRVFGAYANDKDIVQNSSSGGIFSLLSKIILDNNGLVYGAKFDDQFNVIHDYIEKYEEIDLLRGSKYTQSNLVDTFCKIKLNLINKRIVLFSGTPCQIAGLKSYLKEDYENLYCIDIVCHGVPSNKVYKDYLNLLQKKYNSDIQYINFRNKKEGWENYNIIIKFKNGKEIIEKGTDNIYMKGFLSNIYIRPSCTTCKFKDFKSKSDITLGDFWGINHIDYEFYNNEGVSLVCINSEKGLNLFNQISKEDISIREYSIEDGAKENTCLVKSTEHNKNRLKFFNKYNGFNIERLVKKYTKISNYLKFKIYIHNIKYKMKIIIRRLI